MKEFAVQCLKEGPWYRYVCRERAAGSHDAIAKAAKRWDCNTNEVAIVEERKV